jgi:hypothetical protein
VPSYQLEARVEGVTGLRQEIQGGQNRLGHVDSGTWAGQDIQTNIGEPGGLEDWWEKGRLDGRVAVPKSRPVVALRLHAGNHRITPPETPDMRRKGPCAWATREHLTIRATAEELNGQLCDGLHDLLSPTHLFLHSLPSLSF